MVKILAFDTETNENISSFQTMNLKDQIKHIDECPYIIQLGYVLYDTAMPSNTKFFDKIIDIPPTIIITSETTKIHHITNKKIQNLNPKYKLSIYDALKEFMEYVSYADVIVGHNIDFDRKMCIAEILRCDCDDKIKQQWLKEMTNTNKFVCTMKLTKSICNIKMQNQIQNNTRKINKIMGKKVFDKTIIKQPKLIEAYFHFFGYKPSKNLLHNAIIDSIVCLRVYCMCLKPPIDVYGTNNKLTKYINSFSPRNHKHKKNKTMKNKTNVSLQTF